MDENYISITTVMRQGACSKCGELLPVVSYDLNGYATTAQIGDGMLSAALRGLSIRLVLSLCKPCLAVILSEKNLTLQG